MLKLFNTLSKKIEEFQPSNPGTVTLYSCGPTVYDFAHIGNFRTYVMTDILVRTLKFLGYKVKYVTNITDVGHLVSDADSGEDKLEKGAKREGKTAWEVAKFYTEAFLEDGKKLNLLSPDVRPKPTDHIPEQVDMVRALLDKGYAYRIDDGIYFDTSKFAGYGNLTGQSLDELKVGARVEVNPQKRNATDFALWKFSPKSAKRDMEWDSPWGKGFPGWHIECSAMSRKYLGDQIDIHTGGADLIPIHHTNEIAQSEAATGKKPFVRYWVHGQFIMVDGEKMAKSKANFYRLTDIEARRFDPLALRYLYLTAHYRSFLNFTWESLENAAKSLDELRLQITNLKPARSPRFGEAGRRGRSHIPKGNILSDEKLGKVNRYHEKFQEALENDLNIPQALAVLWEVVKSNIPSPDKYDLILNFDEVFGLKLADVQKTENHEIPHDVVELLKKRDEARLSKKFEESDALRKKIELKGYSIEDTIEGTTVVKKKMKN